MINNNKPLESINDITKKASYVHNKQLIQVQINEQKNVQKRNKAEDSLQLNSISSSEESRSVRIASLKERIQNGEYKVDTQLIAKAIVEEIQASK